MKAKLNITYPFGNDYNLNKGLLKAITEIFTVIVLGYYETY